MDWLHYEYLFRCWFLKLIPMNAWFCRKTEKQQESVIKTLKCDFEGEEETKRSEYWDLKGRDCMLSDTDSGDISDSENDDCTDSP